MLRGSILQTLVDSCRERTNQTPFNYGVYYKNTLVSLCHALEDSILAMDCEPIVMTAFQRGKWYLQEAERYREISEKARHITILASPDAGFAEHPTGQKDNVSLVSLLPDDPVTQEWHLIILSPTYTAMVMCQELSDEDYGPNGVPSVDIERKFYGFWTFESDLVTQAATLMLDCCDRYDPALRTLLQPKVDTVAAALAERDTTETLSDTVGRVVGYLQERQQTLEGEEGALNERALGRNLNANELQAFLRMAQAIDLSDTANPMAASEVASLCEALGQLLDLPAWQIKRLRLAGMLHRIDYLPGTKQPLTAVTTDDRNGPSCPLPAGAQALRMMPKLRAIAQIVNHQTEAWDGSGQPAALSADAIPLESRILGLTAAFQRYSTQGARQEGLSTGEAIAAALARCQSESGTSWDPKLVETLQLLTLGLQQGLSLPASNFKLSSGLWAIDDGPTGTPHDRASSALPQP